MSITGDIGRITMSFHTPPNAGYLPAPVALPDLTAALDALQRAIYMVAAHERHLPGIRNLSDDVRRHHTFALLGIQSGDPEIELAPLSAFPRETAPTLFSPEEMARINRESATTVVAAAAQAVQALAACFGGQAPSQPGSLAYQLRRYALILATIALRSGQTIRLRVVAASSQVEFETDAAGSFDVLVRAAVERGEFQYYPNCIVREVSDDEYALLAEVPAYGHALVRCEYRVGPDLDVVERLDVGDRVTIVGTPQWTGGQSRTTAPDVIEVAAILDDWRRIIRHPFFDQLVKEVADEPMMS